MWKDAVVTALYKGRGLRTGPRSYRPISLDSAKAFDKAPYHAVLRALSEHGVRGNTLNWFASFLSGRTQRVRVGHTYSTSADVVSGVVQGSVVGPCLYTIFVDSLLRDLRCSAVFCYADDIKLIFDVYQIYCS
jgi:hypothetical protein